jgi:hypothetical protein
VCEQQQQQQQQHVALLSALHAFSVDMSALNVFLRKEPTQGEMSWKTAGNGKILSLEYCE